MNIYWWFVVIFLTALVTLLVTGYLTGNEERVKLGRLADPAPLPYELPRAGRLPVDARLAYCRKDMNLMHPIGDCPYDPVLGPFDLPSTLATFENTGPLILLSEAMAAVDAHEREVRGMIAEAERKIGPVQ